MVVLHAERCFLVSEQHTCGPLSSDSDHNPTSRNLTSLCHDALKEFLSRLDFHLVPPSPDSELRVRVESVVKTWNAPLPLHPFAAAAVMGTATAYGHISDFETKVQIALFTTIILALDDPAILDALPSQDFHHMFTAGSVGRSQDAALLEELRQLISGMWTHYPRFSASAIATSALDFINMTILENETKDLALSSDCGPFLLHRRTKTATAEAYAHFIWDGAAFPDVKSYIQAIPDTMLYVNYVNDILSFYKEELAGETGNYIGDRARIEGKSPMVVLREMIDEAVAATTRARHVLGEGKAREAWESFARGYVAVHMLSPRYRLQEVIDLDELYAQ